MKFGEVVELGASKKIKINNAGEYVIAGVQSYGKGVVNRRKELGKDLKMKEYQQIEKGYLMWCKVDTKNGAFGITKEEHIGSLASQNMCLAKIKTDKIFPDFLERLFQFPFFHGYITHLSSGSTNRKYLTPTQLCEIVEIPSLSIKEQRKFLELAKALDENELLSQLKLQQDLLTQLRQSFLREAMQGKLVKQDPKDCHAKHLLEKIKAEKAKSGRKEKELPPIKPEEIPFEIPENWVWCRLGEICNYGSSPKAEAKDIKSDTWVLDLEDIEKETSRLLCKIRYSERKSLSTKSVFKKGDVLYSKLRPYLDKVIVADEEGVCTTEILPLKLYGGLNPFLVRYALKRTDFLSYVNSVTKGMKMPRLGTKEGEMALIPIPPLPEQKRIVEKLDGVLRLCDDLQESIQVSREQNELLLQQVLKEALSSK